MFNSFIVLFGKVISKTSSLLNLGAGSTWPGHIALKINPKFIHQTIAEKTKIVLIAGTNGKTTTATLISEILMANGASVSHNRSGANQLNGIASAIISGTKLFDSKLNTDYLILEVDENVLSLALQEITPDYIICLNLFRDQLDRYGEIDSIITKWKSSFENLRKDLPALRRQSLWRRATGRHGTTLILNADDPQVAFLGENPKNKVLYFGLNENNQKGIEHGADSTYCPNCLKNLAYKSVSFSHLGNWSCPECGLKRPDLDIDKSNFYPLLGTYNRYNTLAAILLAVSEKVDKQTILRALKNFKPAFGRQEEIKVKGTKVKFFLSKNPTSFNESLSTISSLNPKNLLIILNDHPVDGTDVSWIWDTNLKGLKDIKNIVISGDRVYDMSLRLKYENAKYEIQDTRYKSVENLNDAVHQALSQTKQGDFLYVLPTYSAMLEIRKILKGRSIL